MGVASEAGCARQDASGALRPVVGNAPEKIWPVEMSAHVEALARAGRLEEARTWWFRGATRFMVWDSLAQAYAGETFNDRVTANILRLTDIDMETYAQLQLSALDWEATSPLDLPEQFPVSSLEKLPQIRAQLSEYVRKGIEAERKRRGPIEIIRKQISEGRPLDEALSIIPASDQSLFLFSGAAFTGCDFGLNFAAHDGASVGDGGDLAAIDACNQLRMIDMRSGSAVQTINKLDRRFRVLAVSPLANDIGILTFQSGSLSDPKTGFYRTTSRAVMEKLELPLPAHQETEGQLSVERSVASADGKIAVLEMCIDRSCPFFVAYDLTLGEIIWQAGDPDAQHERLIANIVPDRQGYLLVSELRRSDQPFAGAVATELLNLTTGVEVRTDQSTLEFSEKPANFPQCNLVERKEQDGGMSFDQVVVWPSGRAPAVLQQPSRVSIGGCTVSPDGRALLVIVSPFIYRYQIRSNEKTAATRN